MTYTPRKGDPVVIERTHSCHDIKMKRTTWVEYQVGHAARLVDGLVVEAMLPHSGRVKQNDLGARFLIIAEEDKREGAHRLIGRITSREENSWPSKEAIQKAISEAFCFQRIL